MEEEICLLHIDFGDDYKKLCGQVYLNSKGLMIFHCTLCEGKIFNGFEIYAQHIEDHKPMEILHAGEDIFTDSFVQSNNNDDSCSELVVQAFYSESSDFGTEDEALQEAETPKKIYVKKNKSRKKATRRAATKSKKNKQEKNAKKAINLNTIDNKTEIRPLRKKTNYFPTVAEIRPLQCDICDAAFKYPSTLSNHKARHQTEKTHSCPKCPKMFYSHYDMKGHLVTHLGERPFLCDICGKTLLNSVKLKDHMRRHTNQRDYECPDCKRRFFNSNLLRDHKLVHKSEKSYACTFCDSKFKYSKGLYNHRKIHENKREYKCDLCEAEFNQQAGLFCHKKHKHQMELNL